ncbi:hypothetical protein O0L34_g9534 [Tuta absoluta]|nr:hypothetical protein O0L34_g9534 [Tuta absoluta]
MKIAWRFVLDDWKKTNLRATTVPKDSFPALLKKGIITMDEKPPKNKETEQETSAVKRNLISSFKATGIFPFDREQVLKRLPQEGPVPDVENVVRDQLTEFLKEQRLGKASEPARKKKRLQVEAGKSISTVDVPLDPEEQVEAEMNISTQNEPLDPEEEVEAGRSVSTPVEPLDPKEQDRPDRHDDDNTDSESENNYNNRGPEIGQFILAKFGSKKGKKTYHYVCSIEDICDEKLVVQGYKSQKKTKKIFRPVPNDVSEIETCDIITFLPQPTFDGESYNFPADVMIKEL